MKTSSQTLLAGALLLAVGSVAVPATDVDGGASCKAVDAGFDVEKVINRAQELSTHSWEYGTASEALLELYNPEFAVFSPSAFPGGKIPKVSPSIRSLVYAKKVIRTNNVTLIDGDGASGDPASLGVSALLLGQSDKKYFYAAQREECHLIDDVPRLSNGAISHRDNNTAAWADFIFMAPPFLAYYAAATNDVDLLKEAAKQCGLYRQLLSQNNLNWKHIIVQDGSGGADLGLWSTGNSWAAAGMARVLATISNWETGRKAASKERQQLVSWIKEIVDGDMTRPLDKGLLRNYVDDTTWFGENSGSSLIAATIYRLAVLAPETFNGKYITFADNLRKAVAQSVKSDGTISPAVNPLGWGDRTPFTTGSPEGQSFGAMLYSAYRDCVCAGKCK